MYVISKQVLAENGSVLGKFSSNEAAIAAMYRTWNPEYKPLAFVDSFDDLIEEQNMRDKIDSYDMEVV